MQSIIKKLALLVAVVGLVGCERQGGTGNDYNRDMGTRASTNNVAPRNAPSATLTNDVPAPPP